MPIRNAVPSDIPDILRIYEVARETMRQSGNPTQWAGDYPGLPEAEYDIAAGTGFVIVDEQDVAHATFMFAPGPDPTYAIIEDGAWLDDEPYGVIHRIASDGQLRDVLSTAVDFCRARIPNLRIDTHEDNVIMQHVLAKKGFMRCGIIYLETGDPRVAFQLAAC